MAANRPEEAHRLFAEAFNAGDLEALLALYEPGAKLAPQPGQVVEGLAAIREALQHLLALEGKMTIETQYAIEAGDITLLRGRWRLTGSGPNGQPVEMQGNSTEVVRRQADGSWLYVIDHPFGAD